MYDRIFVYRPCDAYAKASKGSVRLTCCNIGDLEAESGSAFDESSLQNQWKHKSKKIWKTPEGG